MPSSELYADGGVCGKNGQAKAGVWAWCLVEDGVLVREDSGFITLENVAPYIQVSNNVTELLAVVFALESMQPGWTGRLFSDSLITLRRVFYRGAMNGVPEWLQKRAAVCTKGLGRVQNTLLAGHPERYSKAERDACKRKSDDMPLSFWNQHCDKRCNEKKPEAEEYLRIQGALYECQEEDG